jgi:hypothetical protein
MKELDSHELRAARRQGKGHVLLLAGYLRNL